MSAAEQLVIVVPDGAYPLVLSAFLERRRQSLGLREVSYTIIKDMFRDSSREAVELLRPFQRHCTHALVIRDLHGSGWETRAAAVLASHLKEQMVDSGWAAERCGAVVVDPEIEAWLRFDSSHMHALLRERARRRVEWDELLLQPLIERTIDELGGRGEGGKPLDPKQVFESVLRYFGIQRSNALYGRLAAVESLQGCTVPSFNQVKDLLFEWFPAV